MHISALALAIFALSWLAVIYVLNCVIAGEVKRVDLKLAVLYFFTLALVGLFGEIFLDTVYNAVVGHPLWYYRILPIVGGYTSSFAVVSWGLYGFHLYLLHGSLHAKWSISRTRHLALIFSLEALVLEAAATISAKVFLGRYLYYYLPADLWHVSSFQNLPFYFVCGVVTLATLKRFKADPVFFSFMSAALLSVLLILAS
jgi:hypothetical protein